MGEAIRENVAPRGDDDTATVLEDPIRDMVQGNGHDAAEKSRGGTDDFDSAGCRHTPALVDDSYDAAAAEQNVNVTTELDDGIDDIGTASAASLPSNG